MKFLRSFGSTQQRDAVLDSIDYKILHRTAGVPGVTIAEGSYSPHDYVEIGGVKWATMNLGAETIYQKGLYFQWGETTGYLPGYGTGKKSFSWNTYTHANGSSSNIIKYCASDGKTKLDPEDDAVRVMWGGKWRLPTHSELYSLVRQNFEKVANYEGSGVAGILYIDKNDSSKKIFFPYTGKASGTSIIDNSYDVSRPTSWGNPEFASLPWTNECQTGDYKNARLTYSYSDNYGEDRSYGHIIRGVLGN